MAEGQLHNIAEAPPFPRKNCRKVVPSSPGRGSLPSGNRIHGESLECPDFGGDVVTGREVNEEREHFVAPVGEEIRTGRPAFKCSVMPRSKTCAIPDPARQARQMAQAVIERQAARNGNCHYFSPPVELPGKGPPRSPGSENRMHSWAPFFRLAGAEGRLLPPADNPARRR